MEREHAGADLTPAGRISIKQVAAAMHKVHAMDLAQRISLADEIFIKQPHLLASCLVQPRLGVGEHSVEFLLNILLVCYQAMKESGLDWPLISEDEQARHLQRTVGAVKFSEEIPDPTLAEAARKQYLANHPEQALLAFVLSESNTWLRNMARRQAESESDKFVMMASINLVNCIAYSDLRPLRA
jgi:hypothetical protein